jgi:hypothetical protein
MGLAAAEGSSRARGGRGGGGDAGGQHQAGGSEPVDSSLLQVHLCSYLGCVLRCHPQTVLSGCEKKDSFPKWCCPWTNLFLGKKCKLF